MTMTNIYYIRKSHIFKIKESHVALGACSDYHWPTSFQANRVVSQDSVALLVLFALLQSACDIPII